MLTLTRRIGETLLIRDDIKITVFGVKGNQVRIGIDAPDDVLVLRQELTANDSSPPQNLAKQKA